MKIKDQIRRYWHDIYYSIATERGVRYAMTCKDYAEQVDVGISKTLRGKLRFYLHQSLCQGCSNYANLTEALKVAIRTVVSEKEKNSRVQQLNNDLLEKYSKK